MFEGATVVEPDAGSVDRVYVVHPGLEGMEPGVVLAAFLSGVDVARLSDGDRVRVLKAHQRLLSHYQAQVYADMAAIGDSYLELDAEFSDEAASTEIRVALHLTRRMADSEYGFAQELRDRLPTVFNMLSDGVLDVRRARTIEYGTSHLDEATARRVVDKIKDCASDLTTGQLAARIRRLCVEADPDEAKQRTEEALENRRIVAEPTVDGTAHLMGLDLPSERVTAASQRINKLAVSLKTKEEQRSMDQLRADIFLDLLLGVDEANKKSPGSVNITVDLHTLTGLADNPGELAGYGPVISDIARQTALEQSDEPWKFTVTNNGVPVHTGTTRRRPTADVTREVLARDETCVFPGCRMPAVACDLDHIVEYGEDGPTTPENLAPACRHDHVIRHRHGWTYERLANGDYEWTSPLGHTTTTHNKPP